MERVTGPVSPEWFAVAVQALMYLARTHEGEVCPSAQIAEQVGRHAVFLRRVVAPLVRAGLVEAREGRDGGYRLARAPERISLAEVYRAVKAAGATLNPLEGLHAPMFDRETGAALDEVIAETEEGILAMLERHTLARLIERADTLSGAR